MRLHTTGAIAVNSLYATLTRAAVFTLRATQSTPSANFTSHSATGCARCYGHCMIIRPWIFGLCASVLISTGCVEDKDSDTDGMDSAADGAADTTAGTTTSGESGSGSADGTAGEGSGNGDETGGDGDAGGNSIINACQAYCDHLHECHGSPMPDPDDEDPPWLETCLGGCDYIEYSYMPDANCANALLAWYQCMVVTSCDLHWEDLITTCQVEREAWWAACEGLE